MIASKISIVSSFGSEIFHPSPLKTLNLSVLCSVGDGATNADEMEDGFVGCGNDCGALVDVVGAELEKSDIEEEEEEDDEEEEEGTSSPPGWGDAIGEKEEGEVEIWETEERREREGEGRSVIWTKAFIWLQIPEVRENKSKSRVKSSFFHELS